MSDKYLPLQYCIDVEDDSNKCDDATLEALFEIFSDRDFGSYPYSFSTKPYADFSRKVLMSALKPRMVEGVLQPLEVPLVLELWKKTKQVYEPNAEFSKVLLNTSSIKVYPELLRRIPFKDFYIELSGNANFNVEGIFVSIRVYDNDEIRILYMATDKVTRKKFVDILDFTTEENPMLNLEKVSTISEQQKTIMNLDRSIISARGGLLNDKRICTAKNYVSKPNKSSYYNFDKTMCPTVYQGHNYCYIEINKLKPDDKIADIAMFIIQFLLYLSSKEPNITESELTKTTFRPYTKPKNRFSQIRKWDVELYYGEKIKLLEEKEKKKSDYKGGSHKSPRPHTRRAHWHSYWCGKGEDKHVEIRWIDFAYVNGTVNDIIVRDNETAL